MFLNLKKNLRRRETRVLSEYRYFMEFKLKYMDKDGNVLVLYFKKIREAEAALKKYGGILNTAKEIFSSIDRAEKDRLNKRYKNRR